MDRVWNFYQFLAENAYLYQEEFFTIVTAIMVMIVISSLHRKSRREWRRFLRRMRVLRKGIKQMTKEEYREYLKTLKGDAIFNALEDLVEAKKITRHDCTKTLRAISNILNIPGFVSKEKFDLTSLTAEEFEVIQSVLRSKKQLTKLVNEKRKSSIPTPDPKVEETLAGQRRAQLLALQGMAQQKTSIPFGGTLLKRKTAIV